MTRLAGAPAGVRMRPGLGSRRRNAPAGLRQLPGPFPGQVCRRIILPFLDEEEALPPLLAELSARAGLLEQTLFVDNGSSDGGPGLVAAAGARRVYEPRRGYDHACMAGLRRALADGAEIVVFMEADGTDDPDDLPRLIGPVLAGDVDLMIGSRRDAVRRAGGMARHQRLGNRLSLALIRLLYGLSLPDNGPFRAARTDVLVALGMKPSGYAWTTEMLLRARLDDRRIAWVETGYRPRIGRSKITGTVRGTWGAFRGIVGTAVRLRFSRRPGSAGFSRRGGRGAGSGGRGRRPVPRSGRPG
jgi:glycosyltransferase involved in cell wall biosynthesis